MKGVTFFVLFVSFGHSVLARLAQPEQNHSATAVEISVAKYNPLATFTSSCAFPIGSGKNYQMSCNGTRFRFAAIADWGIPRAGGGALAVADAINKMKGEFDFIVAGGDNFYENGVSNVNDGQWTKTWFDRYRVTDLNAFWVSILGNHDHYGNEKAQVEYMNAQKPGSKYWFMPSEYYSIDVTAGKKKTKFVFLDTDASSSSQTAWFDSEAQSAASSKTPTIVIGHHHVFSHGYRGDNEDTQFLAKKFAKYGIKNYICGHEHDMQYLTYNNINYFLIGGGGASVRSEQDGSAKRKATKVYYTPNYGISLFEVDLETNQLTTTYEIYNKNGKQIDTHVFQTSL
jgi:hypothetical protein